VLPVKKIVCFSRTEKSTLEFKSAIQKSFPDVEVQLCENSEAVINQADLIVTATNSPKPIFDAKKVKTEGKVFIAMGSYRPQMQELPDEVFQQCREIIIDATGIKKETGDLLNAISNGWVKDEDVFTLGRILKGDRESISKTKVFKSAGYALFDLFVAEEIYNCALKKGVGRKIEFK
jgi:ornithine cyclodeaminase